jgi:hypothetical protein
VGFLLALAAIMVLLWLLRDRRTPYNKLAEALRDNDRAYLQDHLPRLTPQEMSYEARLLVSELDEEARDGKGTGEWDHARFERRCFEARRLKYTRAPQGYRR